MVEKQYVVVKWLLVIITICFVISLTKNCNQSDTIRNNNNKIKHLTNDNDSLSRDNLRKMIIEKQYQDSINILSKQVSDLDIEKHQLDSLLSIKNKNHEKSRNRIISGDTDFILHILSK